MELAPFAYELLEKHEKASGKKVATNDIQILKTISYLACRSAIKAGDCLTQDERKNLLDKLEATTTNYTCPHGRPVKLEISLNELAKMFKRA